MPYNFVTDSFYTETL